MFTHTTGVQFHDYSHGKKWRQRFRQINSQHKLTYQLMNICPEVFPSFHFAIYTQHLFLENKMRQSLRISNDKVKSIYIMMH